MTRANDQAAPMRAKGQGLLAAALILAVAGAGIFMQGLADRQAGAFGAGLAPSGTWVCPHGGGPNWKTTIHIANPGSSDSTVIISSMDRSTAREKKPIVVPAGTQLDIRVPSLEESSSTVVEWFGGWVGAGWVSHLEPARHATHGVSAEPCASPGNEWLLPDGSTSADSEHTDLVIANPTRSAAIVTLTLLTDQGRRPTPKGWVSRILPGRRSVVFHEAVFEKNKEVVSALLRVVSGKVAVASVVMGTDGAVRSTIGSPVTRSSDPAPSFCFLPGGPAGTDSQVVSVAHGRPSGTLTSALLSGAGAQALPSMAGVTQAGNTAVAYPVATAEEYAVSVRPNGFKAAFSLRSRSRYDLAATGGNCEPASSWLVLPAAAGTPSVPSITLIAPGNEDVKVRLRLLRSASVGAQGQPDEITVKVLATSAVGVARSFLGDGLLAVVVTSEGGPILASSSATSLGGRGEAGFAYVMGLPIPDGISSTGA